MVGKPPANHRNDSQKIVGLSATARLHAFALQRTNLLNWLTNQPLASTQSRRAKVGGEYRARTGDLLVANQALSQLS